VFVLQSTCSPSNDNLMELLVMIDAVKRSSARRITAVIPYYGYARQDRRPRTARVAITAKLVADMITAAGADRVLTVDLHADQIQGFFNIPTDNIYASPILLGDIWRQEYEDLLVVSPDVGGVVRARAMAKHLEADLAIIDKRRAQSAGVLHAPGAFGQGRGADQSVAIGRAGRNRHDSAPFRRRELQAHPATDHRRAARGVDAPRRRGRFDQYAIYGVGLYVLS